MEDGSRFLTIGLGDNSASTRIIWIGGWIAVCTVAANVSSVMGVGAWRLDPVEAMDKNR